jgi:tetratricopeptide (TPR) repeat protein
MRGRRLVSVRAGLAAWALIAAGCATVSARSPQRVSEDGWQALAEGRRADAQAMFDRTLRTPGPTNAERDSIALFGRATIDYERGAPEAAIDGFAATLIELSDGPAASGGLASLVAPVAAGRVLALFDEIGPASRRAIIERLAPLRLAHNPALPWLARVELLRLASHAAHEIGDATELARIAGAAGCLNAVADYGIIGPLASADLDASPPARAPPGGRAVAASGCRVELPSTADGRGGARMVRAAFQGAAGAFEIVLDYAGEGRVSVDGGAARRHGSDTRYGPRISATRVDLGAGKHDLEIRIATRAAVASFSVYVLPAAAASAAPAPTGPLADYCAAAIAQRVEATDDALAAVGRLRARPRFAVGLALAGAVAHDDPSRPANIARDAARSALRAALAADPELARAWNDLAALALEDERPRDAIEAGRAAARAAPRWWSPRLLLARAFTARGLDFDANRAVEGAAQDAKSGDVPCPVVEALRRRAQDRRALDEETRLESALVSCGGNVEARVERLRARGDLAGGRAVLQAALRLDPERDDLAGDRAMLLSAEGKHDEALAELRRLVARDPNDPQRRLHLADALAAAGQATAARETISAALAARPDAPEVQRAARALGVALPLDGFRVDGRAVIRAFEAAAVRYTAPAVMVLDRAVMRVFTGGTVMTLTHQIVRVDSKDAVDKWAEIAVPPGAEILTLRTHKRDGSTREPEEIAGKETISAADVALGDYIEWEYLETRPPSAAFGPGFLVDRFFFQSFDAPMARSELPGAVRGS